MLTEADANAYHLRMFLVSHCNLRCTYCNPEAIYERAEKLSDKEAVDTLRAASNVGIRRVHYSGGEPTLRKSLVELVTIARELGFTEQVITSNGLLFQKLAQRLKSAGLSRVNLSLDSLDSSKNQKITGVDGLSSVLEAVQRAVDLFGAVKLNVVLLSSNVDEVEDFIRLSDDNNGKVIVRFIELQSNQPVFFKSNLQSSFVPISEVEKRIQRIGASKAINVEGENPNCFYYTVEGTKARYGVIPNVSRGYPCGGCRKIRISPYGHAGVCINAEGIQLSGLSGDDRSVALTKLMQVREELDTVRPNRRHLSDAKGFWRWGDVSEEHEVDIVFESGDQIGVDIK